MSGRDPERRGSVVELLVEELDGESAPTGRRRGGGERLRVPHGVPGDRLLARPVEPGRAALLEVLEPSPDRVDPPCLLSRTCGNCPWMSVSLERQRRLREGLVYRWLEEEIGLGREEIPEALSIRSAGDGLGYRSRARFQVGLGGRLIGFHLRRGPRVVEVPDCPLLSRTLARLYRGARRVLTREPVRDLTGFELVCADGGKRAGQGALLLNPRDRAPAGAASLAARLVAALPLLTGVAWQGGSTGRTWVETRVGPADESLGEKVLVRKEVTSFSQVNDAANALLVEEVLRALAPAPRRVLELHAGSGNLSLPLAAAGHELLSVETHPAATAALEATVRGAPGLEGSLRVAREDAGRVLARAKGAGEPFDAVVLDPPRSGAGRLTADLLRLGAGRIVLVSCRPRTLARDLVPLIRGGYRLARVAPLDFFPHTRHVEAVVRLDRGMRAT
jgi:23S rRNA (uracil1939-C5)-methyltransferase